jgi:CrcB protein
MYLRRIIKYPYGIVVINVLGSFIVGISIGTANNFHTFIGIGFAGAFTTWSTFILDLYLAFELKRYREVTVNLLLTLLLGLGAAWLGIHLAE